MPTPLIEICVDGPAGLAAAIAGGADRIELCTALALGGLTPSAGLVALAARAPVPVHAMIRPREGDFVYDPEEVDLMCDEIAAMRKAGLRGVVFGANREDGTLDVDALARLVGAAAGLDVTLHRAFDLTPDPVRALDQAVALGMTRILTSGGEDTAIRGAAVLERLFAHAAGRIVVVPGSGVNARTVGALHHLPLTEIHASCAVARAVAPAATALGFAGATRRETDMDEVRALRAALG